ncbi:MAG TPA: hypothetical protein VKG25_29025 [Bryobacteraceae bacterium]|nr:hypothetical protein [Bryobacteraceae bacterium]
MSPDSLFSVCNTMVLPAWLLLMAASRWRSTNSELPAMNFDPLLSRDLLTGAWRRETQPINLKKFRAATVKPCLRISLRQD